MAKGCKCVNGFRFINPGRLLISCRIISFQRGITPVGLGYSDVSLEAKEGRTKEYDGHLGLCSRQQTLERCMSRTVRRTPALDTSNIIIRCRHVHQLGSRHNNCEYYGVVGCDSLYSGRNLPSFWGHLLPGDSKPQGSQKPPLHPGTGSSTLPSALCSETSSI
jgi:hypothetical protein